MISPLSQAPSAPSHWRRYRALYLLAAVCLAPVIASYSMYYALPPTGRTNYGDLIEPQRPTPPLTLRTPEGAPFDLHRLRGNWLLVKVDVAGCDDACQRQLWLMRQLRTMQGKDADRIERVFLIAGAGDLAPSVAREYAGTHFLHAERAAIASFLPAAAGARIEDHIFLIDPVGNLMLRWPQDADPKRMKRDLGRLLKASRIG